MEVITKNEKKGYSLFSILLLLLFIGIIFVIIESMISKKIEEKETETANNSVELSAKKYVNDNKEFFDSYFESGLSYFELPLEILKEKDYVKTKKDGYIKITKLEDYKYEYIKTNSEGLYKKILNNNLIINNEDGLYINELNNEDVYDLKYVFKGENVNNYIEINSINYRIIGLTNSYTIKAIRSEYNTNINSYGLGENVNFLTKKSGLNTIDKLDYLNNSKTNKYFIPGLFFVGYIDPNSLTLIDVYKDEKNNFEITKNSPIYFGYSAFINVSDLLNSSIKKECQVNNINECSSYLKDVIEDGLMTNNSTMINNEYGIYKLEKENITVTTNFKFEKDKEVLYIRGTLDKIKGDGSINNPYKY